jgi:beta-phosphoglucomutase-like phosphatase (HAD superfamily)
VIEDSTTGARAGLSAGARVVAAPNVVDVDLPGIPTVGTLVGMGAADLAAVAGAGRPPG